MRPGTGTVELQSTLNKCILLCPDCGCYFIEAECGEDTLVTAPRHPADNTISNICSAEIQMGCHFQVGVLLNPVMILKHFTCNLQAASSTQSPLPTFYLQKNILLVWSRLLPTAGPECVLGAGRG